MKSLNSKDYLFITFVALALSLGLVLFSAAEIRDFVVYLLAVIAIILALMNPRLLFWVFLAMIPLDNVIITPEWLPVALRPYQLFGLFAIVATAINWFAGKLDFLLLGLKKICLACKMIRSRACKAKSGQRSFGAYDRVVFAFPVFAFMAIINAPDKELAARLALILASFVLLFWLVRNFTQKEQGLFEALWFFAVGTVAVILFGFYQGVANLLGIPSFAVFEQRVNSTFTEPDWFGMYLVILSAILLWFRLMLHQRNDKTMVGSWEVVKSLKWAMLGDLFLIVSLLLLTVARSAWLGLFAVLGSYIVLLYFQKTGNLQKKISKICREAALLAVVIALAVAFIWGTGLSKFHFFNRAASSVSGLQKITISCVGGTEVPKQIQVMDELQAIGCKHIDLEQIEQERRSGREIREILRPDPNVGIRKKLYAQTWNQIKKHPILGQGLGISGLVLGKDEHGSDFNASNIFLETWVSMGLGGLILLVLFFAYPLLWSLGNIRKKQLVLESSFLLLTTLAVLVPNLFNSGLLLGVFWVWLAVVGSVIGKNHQ